MFCNKILLFHHFFIYFSLNVQNITELFINCTEHKKCFKFAGLHAKCIPAFCALFLPLKLHAFCAVLKVGCRGVCPCTSKPCFHTVIAGWNCGEPASCKAVGIMCKNSFRFCIFCQWLCAGYP